MEMQRDYSPQQLAIFEGVYALARQGRDLNTVRVQEIADAAGMGKGSLYEHFKSKEDILDEAGLWCMNRELEQIGALMAKADGYDEMLSASLDYLREVMTCRMEAYCALGRYYQMNAPEQHQWVIQANKQMQEYFQRIAEQGRLENQVDPALSKEVCCDILQSTLIGFAVACHARHMNEAGLDRLSASVSEGLHRALAPRH